MSSDEEMDVEAKGVEAPDVVTKYRTAAEIADKAMSVVAAAIVPGASVVSVCQLGDEAIVEGAGAVYNKARTEKGEKVEKGIAFPTCVSVNNCICHFSPLSDDTTVLKEGDIVSIDLGCHIDGYIALEAKSMLVNDAQATGRAADAMMAAYVAAEAALRVLRPGKTNYDVTETINRAANQFNCKVVEGSLSHQMKRFVIDGNKAIIGKPTYEHRVEEFKLEENEVYAMDIAMSTGEGKAKEQSAKATVFKRQVDVEYMLKMKASRQVFSEINAKYPSLPFVLRAIGDETKSKFGITELTTHGLVIGYPVLYEREGEYIGRIKFTVLILPSQTSICTSMKAPNAVSDVEITDPVLKELLAQDMTSKAQKKNKKKKKKAEATETGESAEASAKDNNTSAMET